MAVDLINSGAFLSADEAKSYLQEFFNEVAPTVGGDVTTSIVSGQVIGLNRLRTFMESIEKYNDANTANPVVAVRIYSASSDRKRRYPKKVKDVVLEPVLGNGEDLHGLFPRSSATEQATVDDQMILGEAMPCPNLCG
jgi:hypothetical protein